MQLEIAPQVHTDMRKIARYIAKDNPGAATAWLRKVNDEFAVILRMPFLFPLAPEAGPEFRRSVVGRYVVFYRMQGNVVRIERIIHGMRDLPKLIGSD